VEFFYAGGVLKKVRVILLIQIGQEIEYVLYYYNPIPNVERVTCGDNDNTLTCALFSLEGRECRYKTSKKKLGD
jgi:hypothetical protein